MIEQIESRIIIGSLIIIAGLVCYLMTYVPALSKKEEKELQELDNEISRLYGGKK